MSERSKKLGVRQFEKTINLEKNIEMNNENSVPNILLDWSVVDNKSKKYIGQFVPIVGFDDKNIYVHTGHENNKYFPIEKNVFEKTRKSKGTDEDLIVAYKD